ncbi:MAG: type II secretion system protein GspD [Xylophilus ampelinus]
MTLDFNNAGIDGVARALALITHRNIVLDPRVKGVMTFSTDSPVTPRVAWEHFVAAIRTLNYVALESGDLVKIVPEAEGKWQSTNVAGIDRLQGGVITTEIFRLDYQNALSMVGVLRPLITANNSITANQGSNSLVITDYAENIRRMRTIVAALDVPGSTGVETIDLKYSVAQEVAVMIRRALGSASTQVESAQLPNVKNAGAVGEGASPEASSLVIIPDIQSNSLLVRASNALQLASVRELARQLDKSHDNINVRVVYLKNIEAVRIAQILRSAFPSQTTTNVSTMSSTGLASNSQERSSTSYVGNTLSAEIGRSMGLSATTVVPAAQPTLGGGIQADPSSNSLIITAPESRFREMRAVIDQLDIRRAQLYVESLVVEVDASKSVDLGLQWATLPSITTSTNLTLGAVAKALETLAGTNILSVANVVTLDNEEAKIVVGQNVPFVTGSYTTTASTNPFTTVERKDVGITLRIRPQIGQDGNIRMTIYQESSSVASTDTTLGPTTNQRSIDSSIVVNDGKIIVLGGLIEDQYRHEFNNLPYLSKLPAVGAVFRSLSRTHKKTNLLVFLRPVVMADRSDTQNVSIDRYEFIGAKQRAMTRSYADPAESTPSALLPAMESERFLGSFR